MDRSIACSLWHLGESSNCSLVLMLIHFLWNWRAADLLIGISPLHTTGSLRRSLDSPLAARFASPSALSFPCIPSCPGVHLTLISMLGCLFRTAAACLWKASTKCCPGIALLCPIARIAAWLSAPIVRDHTSLLPFTISAANERLSNSASNTVCLSSLPMNFLIDHFSSPPLYSTAAAPMPPSYPDLSKKTDTSLLSATAANLASSLESQMHTVKVFVSFGPPAHGLIDSNLAGRMLKACMTSCSGARWALMYLLAARSTCFASG